MADFVNPVWNVFEPQIDDRSITEYSYVRYATTDGLNVSALNGNGQTYRLVSKDLDSYLLPSKALLDLTFKVVDVDGDPITADLCQMHDNVLCIFSKMSHMMNSVPVCEVENPVLTTTIKNLLEYSQDYKNTQGPAQFFYVQPDLIDGAENLGAFNADLPQAARISESKLVRVLIPLNRVFGSLEAYSSVTRGIEHRFELVKEDDSRIKRCIFGDAGNTAEKIAINEMSIWIPKLSPSQLAENHFLEIARNKDLNESISYEAWNGYRTSVNLNSSSLNYQITTSSKKPKYVFVALQKATRLEGAIPASLQNPAANRNPSVFDDFGLKSIQLKVNSKRFPYEQYRLNYDASTATVAQDYSRAYHDFLAILDKDSELDSGSCVSHTGYGNKYSIYAFDVSKDISLFENVQSNYIEVEMIFKATVSELVYVNSVIAWDRSLQMQSDGSALKITRD